MCRDHDEISCRADCTLTSTTSWRGLLSSDLRAAAAVYLEDVNERGIVMLVTRHRDQSQFSRYFYPWSVVGWIRLAEEDEQEDPAARGSS